MEGDFKLDVIKCSRLSAKEVDTKDSWKNLVTHWARFSPELIVECSHEKVIKIFKLTDRGRPTRSRLLPFGKGYLS